MGKIILISSDKGGVAKSTTAAALASAMVQDGKKVLLIDLDSHCTLTNMFLKEKEVESAKTVFESFTTETPFEPVVVRYGLQIVPATIQVAKLNDYIREQMNMDYILKSMLAPLKREFDFILLDSAGHFDMITRNALTAADYVLIPFVGDESSVKGVELMLNYTKIAQNRTNRKLRVLGILQTRYAGRIADKDAASDITEIAGQQKVSFITTKVRECAAVSRAPRSNKDIISYLPNCSASADYQEVYKELKTKL